MRGQRHVATARSAHEIGTNSKSGGLFVCTVARSTDSVMTVDTTEPERHHFENDGMFPNNKLPLLLYRQAVDPGLSSLASVIESHLARNGWADSWRNGVYPFPHYHSTAHEVLVVYSGRATIEFGGPVNGAAVDVVAGDGVVIPAGVAHQRLDSSADFAVLGAYPDGQQWNLLRGEPGQLRVALENIAAVAQPQADPFYGADGPLPRCWKG